MLAVARTVEVDVPDLVAVRLPTIMAAPAITAEWDAGHAVLPLDSRAPEPELRRVLDALRPTHLLDRSGRSALPDGESAAEGVAAVVATSGTTGTPKGVELTAEGIRASALAVSAGLGTTPDDVWLACVPLHGVAGLAILARVRAAHTGLLVPSRFDPAGIRASGATLVSLVATMLQRVLDTPERRRMHEDPRRMHEDPRPGRLRLVLLGGGPVPPGLVERAAAAGLRVVTSYGMTETFGGCVLDGRPVEGADLRIAPDGEILLRGPMVMRGYRGPGAAEATAAALRDGWLHTGDLGTIGEDGRLRVAGRIKELVISGGVNVLPDEVEAVLREHPGVAEVGVAGAPDPEWGERVVAWVVPSDPAAPPTLQELRAHARDRLAPAKAPRQLVLVTELPRTASGKLRRAGLVASWTDTPGA
jgi:O-succinylbenzoic acid--CoA ligase